MFADASSSITKSSPSAVILRVAVASPLRRLFDYLPSKERPEAGWQTGLRVKIPFGSREVIGIIVEVTDQSDVPRSKLKPIITLIDSTPLPSDWMWLCRFTSRYYQHALGDTLMQALPGLLRQGRPLEARTRERWSCTPEGTQCEKEQLGRAKRQAELLDILKQFPHGLTTSAIQAHGFNRSQLDGLNEKGLIRVTVEPLTASDSHQGKPLLAEPSLKLNREQGEVLSSLHRDLGTYSPSLLHGVTGSGKTEVYLQLIETVVSRQQQALVLVPEIGLTPQTLERFRRRFNCSVVMLHSAMTDHERLDVWEAARSGRANIVIGTRSAIFTPIASLGVIIVDEEHDSSFKQQESLRYHARDLALVRANHENIPVVLGSATPSLESLNHALEGRYAHLRLTQRAANAAFAKMELLDLRIKRREAGLGEDAIHAIEHQLKQGQQALVFINRRGFSPTLSCQECGHIFNCHNCDAHMTLHRSPPELVCHHCDYHRPLPDACPKCNSADLRPLGAGTERTEECLANRFADTPILRIDRDSTRRKGAFDEALKSIHSGAPCILVGTQMLAKGHHFPHVTLVVVVNADGGLYSSDFRALEHSAQLLVQVSGRAGRSSLPGRVLIQTMRPEDDHLRLLIDQGYDALATQLLDERRAAQLPPFRFMVLIRAEAAHQDQVETFLEEGAEALKQWLHEAALEVDCLGPVPAPMERRQNRYHAQLMLISLKRSQLHQACDWLIQWFEQSPNGRRIRWSVDVDPITLT